MGMFSSSYWLRFLFVQYLLIILLIQVYSISFYVYLVVLLLDMDSLVVQSFITDDDI